MDDSNNSRRIVMRDIYLKYSAYQHLHAGSQGGEMCANCMHNPLRRNPHHGMTHVEGICTTCKQNPTNLSSALPVGTSNIDQLSHESHLSTFHPWRSLPTELQLQIWRMALPEARVVGIEILPTDNNGLELECSSPIPVALAINQQSRYEALRFYQPLFSSLGSFYFFPQADSLKIHNFGNGCNVFTRSHTATSAMLADPVSCSKIESLTLPDAFTGYTHGSWARSFRLEKAKVKWRNHITRPSIFVFSSLREVILETDEVYSCCNALLSPQGRDEYKGPLLEYLNGMRVFYPDWTFPDICIRLPPGRFQAGKPGRDEFLLLAAPSVDAMVVDG
jgi:hypothetical protein